MAMLTVGGEQAARVEFYYEDRGARRPVVLIARAGLSDLNSSLTVVGVHGAPQGLAWTHPAEVNHAILAFLEN